MQDFKNYKGSGQKKTDNNGEINPDIMKMVMDLSTKYNGASEDELWKAIFTEAKKGFKNGTLKVQDLDTFSGIIAPMLDDKKRKKLYEVIEKIKKSNN